VYTVSGVTGFMLSSLGPYIHYVLPIPLFGSSGLTVGASASIFGLLGALVHYGRKGGSSLVGGEAMRYAVLLFVFGLIMPGVDNYAHAGGFAGGYVASAVMNPLKRERGDHVLAAVGCLVATFIAVLFSVLHSSLPTS
jgi:rhomboid protease GluP